MNENERNYFRYFFEILIAKYLEIEQIKPNTITEKFDYSLIAFKYSDLLNCATDYLNNLYNCNKSQLIMTLIEATIIYLRLINKQITLNTKLNIKSQGNLFAIGFIEMYFRTNSIRYTRNKLEKYLYKIQNIAKISN